MPSGMCPKIIPEVVPRETRRPWWQCTGHGTDGYWWILMGWFHTAFSVPFRNPLERHNLIQRQISLAISWEMEHLKAVCSPFLWWAGLESSATSLQHQDQMARLLEFIHGGTFVVWSLGFERNLETEVQAVRVFFVHSYCSYLRFPFGSFWECFGNVQWMYS